MHFSQAGLHVETYPLDAWALGHWSGRSCVPELSLKLSAPGWVFSCCGYPRLQKVAFTLGFAEGVNCDENFQFQCCWVNSLHLDSWTTVSRSPKRRHGHHYYRSWACVCWVRWGGHSANTTEEKIETQWPASVWLSLQRTHQAGPDKWLCLHLYVVLDIDTVRAS